MFNKGIYRIYVGAPDKQIDSGHLVGEFDDKVQAEQYFAEALHVHVAEIEKGVTRVSLIAR